MTEHQACRTCATTDPAAFNGGRAQVCESCRPALNLKLHGRTCIFCHIRKMPDAFPVVGHRAGKPRYLSYCLSCVDHIARVTLSSRSLAAAMRELGMGRKNLGDVYDFWHRWHPEAPNLDLWNRNYRVTRRNSRGQMIRRCRDCERTLVLKADNFYSSHPEIPPDQPGHWDYLCKLCRVDSTSAYNKDKRLQGDPRFYELRRKAQRQYVTNNPERALEVKQRYLERKKAGEVVPLSERRTHDSSHPRIPRQPFLDWIEETIPKYPGVTEFADLIGIPARTLLRLRSDGGRWIELDTVDRALQREGGRTELRDLYPNLYQDRQVA